jgi:hypothetical protein
MGRHTNASWPSSQGGSRPDIEYASETLRVTHRYEDLLTKEIRGSPYELKTMFKAEGWGAHQRLVKRFKLLKAIDPRLIRMLRPNERVHFLTRGTLVSATEGFFTGWEPYFLDLRAMVFTSDRVLLIQISTRSQPLGRVTQIAYSAIAAVLGSANGSCRLVLRDGRKLNFRQLPRPDHKFLLDFLGDAVKRAGAGGDKAATAEEKLCPKCFKVVKGFPAHCPACNALLTRPFVAGFRTFLFPGLGNWYLGNRGYASVEMLITALLWLFLVILPLIRLFLEGGPPPTRDYWIVTASVLAFVYVWVAVMTHHFARKGLHAAAL